MTAQFIESHGFWCAEVRKGLKTTITPGAPMKLYRVVMPFENDKRSRLLFWQRNAASDIDEAGGVVANLIPLKNESHAPNMYMFPGEVYTFELKGGGEELHISGEFEGDTKDSPPTAIRVLAGRATREDSVVVKQEEQDDHGVLAQEVAAGESVEIRNGQGVGR